MYEKLVADLKFMEGDHVTAADMYLEGARDGDELASFNYGYCLLLGLGRERDPAEAKSFFAFARDMKGGEACYNIAIQYLHGEGVPRDYNPLTFNLSQHQAFSNKSVLRINYKPW